MSAEDLITAYVIIALGVLALLSYYFNHQRKRLLPAPSADHIFRCQNCAYVYTDDDDVDRSRCPQCGTLNQEIKF